MPKERVEHFEHARIDFFPFFRFDLRYAERTVDGKNQSRQSEQKTAHLQMEDSFIKIGLNDNRQTAGDSDLDGGVLEKVYNCFH